MTILFHNDWLKHRNASIHYSTKNESFLRLAEVYHQMGVKNSAFHLSLLDPTLANVDPFSPGLDPITKAKIMKECKFNFWYFLREIARIPESGTPVASMFLANRMNIAFYWLFFNHITTLAVILRQSGKTTALGALAEYLLNFGTMNSTINFLTKSEGLKADTLTKIKNMYDELPPYLRMAQRGDLFNTEMIQLKGLDNKLQGHLSSSSEKQAEKVGRGFTSPINIIDEASFVENIRIALGAMLMSGNNARRAAERADNPYGTLITTTAGDIDDRDGGFIYSLLTGATLWDENFLDLLDITVLKQTIYQNCASSKNERKSPMVAISLSYRQLGLSEEWLQKTMEENQSTPENLQRDLFNKWLSGSKSSPIDKALLKTLNDSLVDQAMGRFYAPHNYLLRWYITEEEVTMRTNAGHHFSIGVDTSDASGRDDISFVVRDHVYGDVICVAEFNEVNLITVANFFASFLIKYSNSTMVIERKSSAPAIIDHMVSILCAAGINPFTRLYNTIYQNKETMKKEYEIISKASPYDEDTFIKYKSHIGFITSGTGITSRAQLYSTTLTHMLKFTGHVSRDFRLIQQVSALVVRNNRIDHPPGGNDDVVIGALLSYWLLTTGRNLSLYGINTSNLLRGNEVYLKEKYRSDVNEFDRAEMIELENAFNNLIEDYRAESDPIISRKLELKIRHMANSIRLDSNPISVEEMLSNIAREKRITRF